MLLLYHFQSLSFYSESKTNWGKHACRQWDSQHNSTTVKLKQRLVVVLFSAVPAPRQLSLLSPPADSWSWVSMHLAEEFHRVVCQHHLVHRLLDEHRPL